MITLRQRVDSAMAFENAVGMTWEWFSAKEYRKYMGMILFALLLAMLPACSAERSTAPVVEPVPQEKILVVSSDFTNPDGSALTVAGMQGFRAFPGNGWKVQQGAPVYISLIGDQKVVIANTFGYGVAGDSLQLKGSFKTAAGSQINTVVSLREWVVVGEKIPQFVFDTSRFVGSSPAMFPLVSAKMRNIGAYSSIALGIGFESACQNTVIEASAIELLLFQGSYNSSWNVPSARLIKLECYSKDQAPASVLAGYQRQISG